MIRNKHNDIAWIIIRVISCSDGNSPDLQICIFLWCECECVVGWFDNLKSVSARVHDKFKITIWWKSRCPIKGEKEKMQERG